MPSGSTRSRIKNFLAREKTPMARSRKFLTVGAIGVASLALIGAGASATFTDALNLNQSITAGTLDMRISGDGDVSDGGKSLKLQAVGNAGSTLAAGPSVVKLTNTGTLDAKIVSLAVTNAQPAPDAHDDALRDQLNVKITSGGTTVFVGKLTTLMAHPNLILPANTVIASTHAVTFKVLFYAGHGMGNEATPSLTNLAQSGVVIPTFKVNFED